MERRHIDSHQVFPRSHESQRRYIRTFSSLNSLAHSLTISHRPFHSVIQLTNSSPLPSTVPSNSTTSLLPSWVIPKPSLATKIQFSLFPHSAVKIVLVWVEEIKQLDIGKLLKRVNSFFVVVVVESKEEKGVK